jgi:hypothetical protein
MKNVLLILSCFVLVSCSFVIPKIGAPVKISQEPEEIRLPFFSKPVGIKGDRGVSVDTHNVTDPVVVPRSKSSKTEVVTLTPAEWDKLKKQIQDQELLLNKFKDKEKRVPEVKQPEKSQTKRFFGWF